MNPPGLNGAKLLAPYGQASFLKLVTKVGEPKFAAPVRAEFLVARLQAPCMLTPYGQARFVHLGTKVGDGKLLVDAGFTAPAGPELQGPPIGAPQGSGRTVIRRKAQAQA